MDTFKEKQELDELYGKEAAPWQLWKRRGGGQELSCRVPTWKPELVKAAAAP